MKGGPLGSNEQEDPSGFRACESVDRGGPHKPSEGAQNQNRQKVKTSPDLGQNIMNQHEIQKDVDQEAAMSQFTFKQSIAQSNDLSKNQYQSLEASQGAINFGQLQKAATTLNARNPRAEDPGQAFDNVDIESSQYASQGGHAVDINNRLTNNQLMKQQTVKYMQYNNFEKQSLGRDMDIDLSAGKDQAAQQIHYTVDDLGSKSNNYSSHDVHGSNPNIEDSDNSLDVEQDAIGDASPMDQFNFSDQNSDQPQIGDPQEKKEGRATVALPSSGPLDSAQHQKGENNEAPTISKLRQFARQQIARKQKGAVQRKEETNSLESTNSKNRNKEEQDSRMSYDIESSATLSDRKNHRHRNEQSNNAVDSDEEFPAADSKRQMLPTGDTLLTIQNNDEHNMTDNRLHQTPVFKQLQQDSLNKDRQQEIKCDYLEYLASQMGLSYRALQHHINYNHPKQIQQDHDQQNLVYSNWSLFENAGALVRFPCCCNRKITEFQKSIGIGPSLYLLSLKAYIKLLIVVCLLAIPQCIILSSGSQSNNSYSGGGLSETFTRVTLGNIAILGTLACGQSNIAEIDEQSISLSCPTGKLSKILSAGLSNGAGQEVCNLDRIKDNVLILTEDNQVFDPENEDHEVDSSELTTIRNYADFHPSCSSYTDDDLVQSQAVQEIVEHFDLNCKGNSMCDIPYTFSELTTNCLNEIVQRAYSSKEPAFYQEIEQLNLGAADLEYERDDSIAEPILSVLAYCDNQSLKIKGFDIELDTDQLSRIIALFDIALVVVLAVGYNLISYMQKDFVRKYEQDTIELRDFTLVIDKLPESFKQYKDPMSLKFALWSQIQHKIEVCKNQGKCNANIDPSIAEINIQQSDIDIFQQQKQLKDQLETIEVHFIDIMSHHQCQKHFYKSNVMGDAKYKIMKKIRELQKQMDLIKVQYSHELGLEQIELHKSEVQEIDQLKAKLKAQEFLDSIKQIHITFQSTQTKKLVEELCQESSYSLKTCRLSRHCTKSDDAREIQNEENKEQKAEKTQNLSQSLYIVQNASQSQMYYQEEFEDKPDQEIKTRRMTSDPNIIAWKNYKLTKCQRCSRTLISIVIIAVLYVITFVSLQAFNKNHLDSQFGRIQNQTDPHQDTCYQDVSMSQAYQQIIQDQADSGAVHCYCKQQYVHNYEHFQDIDFNAYHQTQMAQNTQNGANTADMPSDLAINYCQDWLKKYRWAQLLSIVPSIITALINNFLAIPCVLLLAFYEGHLSKDRIQQSIFLYLFIQWCLSIGFVMPYYSLDGDQHQNEFFNQQWYLTISSAIGHTLIYMFIPNNALSILMYLTRIFKRYFDRNCEVHISDLSQSSSLSKSRRGCPEEENEDKIKSKLKAQRDVNKLYTGGNFDIGIQQAYIMTLIFICLMYSGGMPLLYVLCLVFLEFIYWYSKCMLLKYCQRPKDFNENLIIQSYKMLKFGFVAHLIMTANMFERCLTLNPQRVDNTHFNNQVNALSFEDLKDIKGQPAAAKIYGSFLIIFTLLYVFNLFFINPVTCIFHRSCCGSKPNSRRSIYTQNGGQFKNNQNEPMKYIASTKVNLTQSKNVTFARASKTEDNPLQDDEATSSNYFEEINFNSLMHQYTNAVEYLIQSNQRLNLYYRVAGINKGKQISRIFAKKYESFLGYHQSLVANKEAIEGLIDDYYDFISTNNIQDQTAQRNSMLNVRKQSSDFTVFDNKEAAGDHDKDKKIVEEDRFGSIGHGVKNKPSIQLEELDQDKVEFKVSKANQGILSNPMEDNKSINRAINRFQAQNTAQIKSIDENEESMLREECKHYTDKLEHLQRNCDENQLRETHMPQRFRCESSIQSYSIACSEDFSDLSTVLKRAQLVLSDPFFVEGQQAAANGGRKRSTLSAGQ